MEVAVGQPTFILCSFIFRNMHRKRNQMSVSKTSTLPGAPKFTVAHAALNQCQPVKQPPPDETFVSLVALKTKVWFKKAMPRASPLV